MRTWRTVILWSALLSPACVEPSLGPVDLLDAVEANVRLCGLPAELLDLSHLGPPEYGTSRAMLRVGDRIPLTLQGGLDRIVSVRWDVSSPDYAPHPPGLTLTATSRHRAVLEAISPSGPETTNWAWVSAELTFADGSESVAPISVCLAGSWQPAHHVFVAP